MLTLRISGRDIDVDALLARLPFEAAAVHRKGQQHIVRGRPPLEASTINVGVSGAAIADLALQLSDAAGFLHRHTDALKQLAVFPGVESLVFDFPVEDRDVFSQSDRFPASLLAA